MHRIALLAGAGAFMGFLLLATACDGQGPAQHAGQHIDQAIEDVGTDVEELGDAELLEETGTAIDEAAHAVAGAAEEVGDAAKEVKSKIEG